MAGGTGKEREHGAAAAKRRCAGCGAAVRAKDRFCPSCGTPLGSVATQVAPAQASSASLQVHGHAASLLGEQRKVVTVLFADLSGSTPLAERLDPEELRRVLGSYFGTLARQIQRYEGTIDKYIGDAVMAVFGAPVSHEDDAERAINAALSMQASIARLNDDLERRHGVRLSLRIGVNTGEVVAGMLAGDVQAAYTVVGDAVNTAQRLESVAPPGEVVVSSMTQRLAIHSFEFETLAPQRLKGKAELVVAYRVRRRRDEEIAPETSLFVGRSPELALLRAAMEDVVRGQGSVVEVSGEAGVGKSRLLAELRAGLAAGIERVTARCASFERRTPYGLVADLVRGAFRIHVVDDEPTARGAVVSGYAALGADLDEPSVLVLLDMLGFGERSTLAPEAKRRLIVSLVGQLLERQAARAPLVIVVEDLHWADEASLEVIARLIPRIANLACLFIATARPGWAAPWPARRVTLEPLTEADARDLIAAVLEVPVEADLATLILARTGGNPFFIEEVAQELQRSNMLVERDGRIGLRDEAPASIPATIQEVLEARLDGLAHGQRQVLRLAAVCGRTFWYRVLERLEAGDDLDAALDELERETLIHTRSTEPELTYAFRQALIQEVAYQTQLLSERRATHGRVAAAMETLYATRLDELVDLLAYHYARSDDDAQALRWLVRAADRAKALFANGEALALYAAALERAPDGEGPLQAGSILERIGDVRALIGRYDEAIAAFRAGHERSGATSPSAQARTHRKVGTALRMKGDYDAAFGELTRGLAGLGATDDVEGARILVQLGQLHYRRGEHVAAREPLARAVALAERLGDDSIVAESLRTAGLVAAALGELRVAIDCYERSMAIYERAGDAAAIADVRNNLAMIYRRTQRFDEALDQYRVGLAVRERTGDVWAQAVGYNNIGEVHRTRGEPGPAIAVYERAIAIFESIGARAEAAAALMNLGAARVESADFASGRDQLLEAEARFVALGSTTYLIGLNRYLAAAELAAGDLLAARERAERSLELARAAKARHQEAMAERVLGEIAIAAGDRERARGLLEASARTLAEIEETAELARTQAVLERLEGA
jgi:class 3 adenylate cyclase/tetratricopeptide (TPR) repeat protein